MLLWKKISVFLRLVPYLILQDFLQRCSTKWTHAADVTGWSASALQATTEEWNPVTFCYCILNTNTNTEVRRTAEFHDATRDNSGLEEWSCEMWSKRRPIHRLLPGSYSMVSIDTSVLVWMGVLTKHDANGEGLFLSAQKMKGDFMTSHRGKGNQIQ